MSDFFEGIAGANAGAMAAFTDAASGGPQARATEAERQVQKEMQDKADEERRKYVESRKRVGRQAAAQISPAEMVGAAVAAPSQLASVTPFPFVTE